jgi:uncharacterized protein YbaR (Trm112 family)
MNNFVRHFRYALIPRGPILDVGSGSNPFWRATVLMDRFLADGKQRPGRLLVDRPIVCGDIEAIPFLDKAFEFVFCSHVLEHVKNPGKAISEMVRVGNRGYIETPSEIHEYLNLQKPYHRWAVSLEGGTLVFREKSRLVMQHPLLQACQQPGNRTVEVLNKIHDKVNLIKLFWVGQVNFRIERSDSPIEDVDMVDDITKTEEDRDFALKKSKAKLKWLLGKAYLHKLELPSILACPCCKRQVKLERDSFICTPCNLRFPISEGIPIMVIEKSQKR